MSSWCFKNRRLGETEQKEIYVPHSQDWLEAEPSFQIIVYYCGHFYADMIPLLLEMPHYRSDIDGDAEISVYKKNYTLRKQTSSGMTKKYATNDISVSTSITVLLDSI